MEAACVLYELVKLMGDGVGKGVDADGQFLLQYFLVAIVVGIVFEVLPGKGALEEVDEHVDDTFEVVPAALFDAEMTVDRGVTGSAG